MTNWSSWTSRIHNDILTPGRKCEIFKPRFLQWSHGHNKIVQHFGYSWTVWISQRLKQLATFTCPSNHGFHQHAANKATVAFSSPNLRQIFKSVQLTTFSAPRECDRTALNPDLVVCTKTFLASPHTSHFRVRHSHPLTLVTDCEYIQLYLELWY